MLAGRVPGARTLVPAAAGRVRDEGPGGTPARPGSLPDRDITCGADVAPATRRDGLGG